MDESIINEFDIAKKQNDYLKAWQRVSNQCSIEGIDLSDHKVRSSHIIERSVND